jgi:lysophospholipase L1-like esterase
MKLGQVANATIVNCNELGDFQIYKSDRYGFNNDDTAYNVPIEVMIVGDSFAHGSCVKQNESAAGVLTSRGVNTVTFGVGGYDPLLELGVLREYVAVVKPKHVVWVYYAGNDIPNDMTAFMKTRNFKIAIKYLDPQFSQGLAARQFEIDEKLKNFTKRRFVKRLARTKTVAPPKIDLIRLFMVPNFELRSFISLFEIRKLLSINPSNFARAVSLESKTPNVKSNKIDVASTGNKFEISEEENSHLTLFENIMKRAKAEVQENGAMLHFVFLPGTTVEPRNQAVGREVIKIVQSLHVPILDFGRVLETKGGIVNFSPPFQRGHYNEKGYELLAESIQEELRIVVSKK